MPSVTRWRRHPPRSACAWPRELPSVFVARSPPLASGARPRPCARRASAQSGCGPRKGEQLQGAARARVHLSVQDRREAERRGAASAKRVVCVCVPAGGHVRLRQCAACYRCVVRRASVWNVRGDLQTSPGRNTVASEVRSWKSDCVAFCSHAMAIGDMSPFERRRLQS